MNCLYEDASFFVTTYKLSETFFIIGHVYEHAQESAVENLGLSFWNDSQNQNIQNRLYTKGWSRNSLFILAEHNESFDTEER